MFCTQHESIEEQFLSISSFYVLVHLILSKMAVQLCSCILDMIDLIATLNPLTIQTFLMFSTPNTDTCHSLLEYTVQCTKCCKGGV